MWHKMNDRAIVDYLENDAVKEERQAWKAMRNELAADILPGALEQVDIAINALLFISEHLKGMEDYSIVNGAIHKAEEALHEINEIQNSPIPERNRNEDEGVY